MIKSDSFFKFLTFIFFGFLFFHLAKQTLVIKPDGWYVGQVNLYGDLVFHLTLINKFITSGNFLPDNPIYAQDKINYPIFVDFITAQLARIINIARALFWTTFLGGIIVIFTSRIFIKNLFKNEKIIFLALLLFFLNGGFGFHHIFQDYIISQKSPSAFIISLPREYTNIKDEGYWWINSLLAYFLPQRGFLFAFPITLTVLSLLYLGNSANKRLYFVIAGLLVGVLPIVQAHSLFLIFLISLCFAPISIYKSQKRQTLANWAIFASLSVFLALPIFLSISSTNALHFIRFAPGWTSQENIIWFWFKNLGLFAPILLIATTWLFQKSRHLFLLYLPFLIVFAICNIFIFQPWDFDNSKLLIYWYFTSTIVVSYFLYDQFFREGLFKKTAGLILVVIMILAGGLDILRTFTQVSYYRIFSTFDLKVAESVKILTPKDAIFVTSSRHNHPITALAGRSTLLGFHGWLWSHGIDYSGRAQDVKTIYLGGKDAEELILNYHVNYITIGKYEREEFAINESFFRKFPSINLSEGWQIYDVSHLRTDGNR